MYISSILSFYQKKWEIMVLLLFKSKILRKWSFDDGILTKLRRKSEKTREMVLASPSASQTRRLTSDLKAFDSSRILFSVNQTWKELKQLVAYMAFQVPRSLNWSSIFGGSGAPNTLMRGKTVTPLLNIYLTLKWFSWMSKKSFDLLDIRMLWPARNITSVEKGQVKVLD